MSGQDTGRGRLKQSSNCLKKRVVEERKQYALLYGISEHNVNAKIGVASELHRSYQASQSYRFGNPVTYLTGNVAYGHPTPAIFAKDRGQLLLTGVDSNIRAAVAEAHRARFNFSLQKVKLNHQDTADDCEVDNGEPYIVTNSASVCIQFVRADLKHSKSEPLMTAHSQWCGAMQRKIRLEAAAALLQSDATGGDEAESDEQATLEVLTQRKEAQKKNSAAACSAPKRKFAK